MAFDFFSWRSVPVYLRVEFSPPVQKMDEGAFLCCAKVICQLCLAFDGEYVYGDGGSWLDYSAAVARNLLKWQKVVENRGHFN
jgi:hypothetical protein